jgi:hypothetical protein
VIPVSFFMVAKKQDLVFITITIGELQAIPKIS